MGTMFPFFQSPGTSPGCHDQLKTFFQNARIISCPFPPLPPSCSVPGNLSLCVQSKDHRIRTSENYRILDLESSVNWTRLFRTLSCCILNIFTDGDFTVSLDNLLQCTTFTVNKIFPIFRWISCFLTCPVSDHC